MRKFGLSLMVIVSALIFLSCAFTLHKVRSQETIFTIAPSTTVVSPTPRNQTPSPTLTIIEETKEPEPEPRYGFTEDEIYLLAQLLCGARTTDGDGEYDIDFETKINYGEVSKVLCVVMNRVNSDSFPNTVTDVVMQKNQFSVMPRNSKKTPSDIAIQTVKEWCDEYDRFNIWTQAVPENHLYFTGNGRTNTTRAAY